MRAFSAVMVRVSHIMPALVSALNAPCHFFLSGSGWSQLLMKVHVVQSALANVAIAQYTTVASTTSTGWQAPFRDQQDDALGGLS